MKKHKHIEQKPQVLFKSGSELFNEFANNQDEFVKAVAPNSDALRIFGIFPNDLVFIKKTQSFDENQISF